MIQIPVIDLELNFVSWFCFSYSGLLDEDAAAAAARSAFSPPHAYGGGEGGR